MTLEVEGDDNADDEVQGSARKCKVTEVQGNGSAR